MTSPRSPTRRRSFAVLALDDLGLGTGSRAAPRMDVCLRRPPRSTCFARRGPSCRGRMRADTMGRDVLVTGLRGSVGGIGLVAGPRRRRGPWFRLRAVAPVQRRVRAFATSRSPRCWRRAEPEVEHARLAHLLGLVEPAAPSCTPRPRRCSARPRRGTSALRRSTSVPEPIAGTRNVPEALLTDKGMDLLAQPVRRVSPRRCSTADGLCTGWDPDVFAAPVRDAGDDEAATANSRPLRRRVAGERGANPCR